MLFASIDAAVLALFVCAFPILDYGSRTTRAEGHMEDTGTVSSSTPTTSTPSAPSTTPAAPATSAPSSSLTPGQRPTFAEAFARDAADSSPSTPDSGAAPIAQTGDDQTASAPASTPGEPPQEKWPTILENARKKASAEAEAKFQQQYGWAMQADPAAMQEAVKLSQTYQQDRPAFIRQVLAEAVTDPELAPLVRSEAARVLGSRTPAQTPQAPAVDLSPDIPVMDQDGRVVAQTYSHERLQQVVAKAIEDFATRELSPIKQDYQTRQERAQAERQQQELQAAVTDIYSEASDVLPGFKEHEAEIAKVFATIPGDPAKALRAAWKQVVGGKLANSDQVKADTLKDLQTKAAASAVNPASAVIPATKRPTSFHDASLQWT